MKVLVTGCAGFIGYHFTKKLLEHGHKVTGIDNLNDYYDPSLKMARLENLGIDTSGINEDNLAVANIEHNFTFISISIEDKTGLDIYLEGEKFDAVCHLAAQAGVRYSITNPQAYISSNLQGFFNILELCRNNGISKLIFASSSSVYGNNTKIPYQEKDPTDCPVSLYGATKKSNEVMACSYAGLYGINTVGLRFFTVYGPWGRPDMAPFLFTDAIIRGEEIKVFNNGKLSRDFTYIDDIVEGIYKVLTNDPATHNAYVCKNFRIYNIGNSAPVELNNFISTIEKLTGKKARKKLMPMQPGDVNNTWADTDLLEKDFGYYPSTPLERGLEEFINWYRWYYEEVNLPVTADSRI